jgi:hypothetical protein
MPVFAKIEDSIKYTIKQHMDENPDGAWEDHYNFMAWAYVGEYLTDDPVISYIGAHYDKLIENLCKSYKGVEKGDLVTYIGQVIAEKEYSYHKAWGVIDDYDPNIPDC